MWVLTVCRFGRCYRSNSESINPGTRPIGDGRRRRADREKENTQKRDGNELSLRR